MCMPAHRSQYACCMASRKTSSVEAVIITAFSGVPASLEQLLQIVGNQLAG